MMRVAQTAAKRLIDGAACRPNERSTAPGVFNQGGPPFKGMKINRKFISSLNEI